MKKIEWRKKQASLAEIYHRGLQMTLVSKPDENGVYHQCCPWVLCKDFFQDAVQGHLLGVKKGCYGYYYDPKDDPALSLDRTRIAVGNAEDSELGKKVTAALEFLNQFEKQIHLIRTKADECESPPEKYKNSGVYLFEGSARWMLSPPMISLYTLLLRVGFTHQIGDTFEQTVEKVTTGKTKCYESGTSGSNDASYLKSGKSGIEKILKHGYAKIFHKNIKDNYPASVAIGTMHNNSGIVGFSTGQCKTTYPHWFRMDNPKKKKPVAKKKIEAAPVDTK